MRRLFPRSLLGQVMASAMLALLTAQLVGAFLLYKASEERREAALLTAIAFELSNGAEQNATRLELRQRFRQFRRESPSRRLRRLAPYLRYSVTPQPVITPPRETENARDRQLRAVLEDQGITPLRVATASYKAGQDPWLQQAARTVPLFSRQRTWRGRRLFVAAIQREENGPWETARVFDRAPSREALWIIAVQTLVIIAFLGTILYFVLRRITRPLAQLTDRVDDFSRSPDRAVQLEEAGPSDTRRLIAAHNAMEARIAALLDEKDIMLGAIGHDLKTPLAALRVRIESVPDDAQRERMAASIEDITCTLDDILSLARVGRGQDAGDRPEKTDIGALADSVVEEFEDLGEPVTLELDEGRNARLVAFVQVTWLKRALRNLITNALRYGFVARVFVGADQNSKGACITLCVEDDGPGIDETRLDDMLEPFTRGEGSRNRATGGAGLGLTLARAIAQAHGGTVALTNRYEGGQIVGLRACIQIPAAD